jgi:hypothetical protein
MKTSYDEQYKAAVLAVRAAQKQREDIEQAMVVERGVPEGPRGTYNQRKYQPLRKHMNRLANDAIGYKGYRRP